MNWRKDGSIIAAGRVSSALAGLTLLAGTGPRLAAQSASPASVPEARAVVRHGPIALDGVLDETAWAAALPASGFRQQDPLAGAAATQRTEVRFLFDEEALYVGARMYDALGAGGVATRRGRRDANPQADYFMIVLDTYHDHLGRTVFRTNPSGVLYDAQALGNGNPDPSWDAVWQVATRVDSLGWTAEIRIPFSQLRFPAASRATVWGLQLWRYVQRLNETTQWSYWTKEQAGGPAFFGHLVGLELPRGEHQLELLPYGVMKHSDFGSLGGVPEDGRQRSTALDAGGDLKQALTADLRLSATVNPDFAQVEADPAVLNLTAFETFYPEKRPFFVDDGGLFKFGMTSCLLCLDAPAHTLFYSRRIGGAPRTLQGGALLGLPRSTPILGAARLQAQTGDVSIGILDAIISPASGVGRDSSGDITPVPLAPSADYFAARAKWTVQDGNLLLGGEFIGLKRGSSAAPLGLVSQSLVVGGDLDWWWSNHTYHLLSSIAVSSVSGAPGALLRVQRASARYFQRPDRVRSGAGFFGDGYDSLRTRLSGYWSYTRLARDAGRWNWEAILDIISPGFELNDAGFLPTADAIAMTSNIQRNFTTPGRLFHSLAVVAGADQRYNFEHDLVGRDLHVGISAVLPNYWTITGTLALRPALVDDRLARGGPALPIAASQAESLAVTTDSRGKLSATAAFSGQQMGDGGHLYRSALAVVLRPASNVGLTLTPSLSWGTDEAQYVTTVSDSTATAWSGQRYVFATLDRRTAGLEGQVNVSLTGTLSFDAYAQLLLAGGDFTQFKEYSAPRSLSRNIYGRDIGTISQDRTDGSYTIDPDGAGPAAAFALARPDFSAQSWRHNLVLRWEYRPGCSLYLVWTQTRQGRSALGNVDIWRDGSALFRQPADNVLLVKASYRLAF